MRIRSTKPEFWRSKTIATLPWDVRLVLKGIESYVDDNGVGKDDIALIAADVFPRDLSANPPETLRRLTEAVSLLSQAGLIARYEVDGEELLYVDKWKDIQYVQKPRAGRFPRPDGTLEYSETVSPESYRKRPEILRPGTEEQGNRLKERETAREPNGKALTLIPDNWAPSLTHQAKAKSLGIKDIDSAAEAFRNHALSEARLSANWDAAFHSWLTNPRTRTAERERRTPNGVKPAASDAAFAATQLLKDNPTRLELE